MKKKLFKLIFGKSYVEHPRSFWITFWTAKLKEVLCAVKWIVIVVVGYFALLWFPSAHFAGVQFNPIKLKIIGYTYKTNAFNPGYTVVAKQRSAFINKTVQKQYIDELTLAAQGRSDLTNEYIFKDLRASIFYNNGRNEGDTRADIKIKILPFYEKTILDTITRKYLSFKDCIDWDSKGIRETNYLEDKGCQVKAAIFGWHFVTIAIYLTLYGLFELLRFWLRSNYKKLTRRK